MNNQTKERQENEKAKQVSYNNPRYGRKVSPADTYAIALIEEVYDFMATCHPKFKIEAQHLIERIRFSEITLAGAETAIADLETRNNDLENQE